MRSPCVLSARAFRKSRSVPCGDAIFRDGIWDRPRFVSLRGELPAYLFFFFSSFASFFSLAVFCGGFLLSFLASLDFMVVLLRVVWKPWKRHPFIQLARNPTKSNDNLHSVPGCGRVP